MNTYRSMNVSLENLFIFEMANNHQGDVEHGLKIIRALGEIARQEKIHAGVKFQFRHLDSFVHRDYRDDKDHKHIHRFYSTRLEKSQFAVLQSEIKKQGLISVCTPFDETSVDDVVEMGFDVLKVASCSANDWPLLSKICSAGLPTIISTAGLEMPSIDRIVDYFASSPKQLAILHCVAIYPTPNHALQLHRITELRQRYPHLTIGFSTHEDPNDVSNVQLAYAAGARIFEKHVGLPHSQSAMNSYSATPEQIEKWIHAWKEAVEKYGNKKFTSPAIETKSLNELKRGIYLNRPLKKGTMITPLDTYFAMPYLGSDFVSTTEWSERFIADRDYNQHEPLSSKTYVPHILDNYRSKVLSLIRDAGVTVKESMPAWFSHHFGLMSFEETGAALFTIYNTRFCKKIIAMLPGQHHPKHMHSLRDEIFEVLYGDLEIILNDKSFTLKTGDVIPIPKGTWHEFTTPNGVVIEEVTSQYFEGDSHYEDPRIFSLETKNRRTAFFVNNVKSESVPMQILSAPTFE